MPSTRGSRSGRPRRTSFVDRERSHVYDSPPPGIVAVVMDPRHERISRNEAMYRAVNREIEQASEQVGDGPRDRIEVICECGEDGCSATLELTLAEYDEAHGQLDRFVVAPGHEDETIEHVVTRAERYLVVDKFGEAEHVAEAEERREGVE
jgi:hypothetical protein